MSGSKPQAGAVKCVVWDLDNTLWNGVLLEGDLVTLRPDMLHVVQTLDGRGILQSVASKNDPAVAAAKLRDFGLHDYFLYPQINWNAKAASVEAIAAALNIGIDTIAFVDDQPFERDEVRAALPGVRCFDALDPSYILELPEMNPRFVTEDSRMRRAMYLQDFARQKVECDYVGPKEEFLATLSMRFTIALAREEDLQRAEELTVRTNQLNTTGYTYSYEELHRLRESPRHLLLIAGLDDRYGSYGKIGLVLVERTAEVWTIKLLLMSCRVMSRGVGSIMINYIMGLARAGGVRLQAEFLSNDRNRLMYITYKFAGFKECGKIGDVLVLENDLTQVRPFPSYVDVRAPEAV